MSGVPQEVLVADDERDIREGICALLESEGYRVRSAADGEDALRACRERKPDLLLLDVMMPKMNGYRVCGEIRREYPDLPVIFLTARDADTDELRGLSAGADDYIPKTAAQQIKLARIAAVLRRSASAALPASFMFGRCRVDVSAMRIYPPGGDAHDISARELAILRFFSGCPGEAVSRDFLLTRFWGADFEGGDSALTVAMHRLRGKLGTDSPRLKTVSRQGYRFEPEG